MCWPPGENAMDRATAPKLETTISDDGQCDNCPSSTFRIQGNEGGIMWRQEKRAQMAEHEKRLYRVSRVDQQPLRHALYLGFGVPSLVPCASQWVGSTIPNLQAPSKKWQ